MISLNKKLIDKRIDYHCHLLPGLDDGARDLDDSLAMARSLVDAGFEIVHCTPHFIKGLFDTSPVLVVERVQELQSELEKSGIPLSLRPGMEYYLDEFFPQALENPLPLGDSKLLLVEAPQNAHPVMVQENIFHAVRQGFTPLLAHPERTAFLAPKIEQAGFFQKLKRAVNKNKSRSEPDLGNETLNMLLRQGCQFQANIGSFSGHYGRTVQKRALFFSSVWAVRCLRK